jgi:ABC-type antimicrobial peptide transport system permease subunit
LYVSSFSPVNVLKGASPFRGSGKLLDSIWDYFVEIKPGILILAASIMFAATLLTIIFKIGKAAIRNPVDSLRYE